MLRRLALEAAKRRALTACQGYAVSNTGAYAVLLDNKATQSVRSGSSVQFSADAKAQLLNASPRSLATDRLVAKPHPGVEQNIVTRALLRLGGFYSKESQRVRGATAWYQGITEQISDSRLYRAFGLEEKFADQYSLLCIHLWLCLRRLRSEGRDGKELGQVIYEDFSEDVEIRVRAAGVKVRISKHLTDLEQMFFGSSLSYDQALDGKEELGAAVLRNVYANKPERRKAAELLARYMKRELACLSMTASESVMTGSISFSRDFL